MSDNLTREQRSYCMSQVRSKGTNLEKLVQSELRKRGERFKTHVKALPGKPDIVFPIGKVAVFIDGDFWHGYRFPLWRDKLPTFWQDKIAKNRARDLKNFKKLRRMGWRVLRIWQHQITATLPSVVDKIISAG